MFDFIADWFNGLLIDGITANFTGMFNEVNAKVGEIAGQVGQTPQGWNAGIFGLVRTLSETVVIPIAGMILTFILCYELIQMIIEKNNMAEFDILNIYKWIFKTFCATYILTHMRGRNVRVIAVDDSYDSRDDSDLFDPTFRDLIGQMLRENMSVRIKRGVANSRQCQAANLSL